jgi:hypothetical protein
MTREAYNVYQGDLTTLEEVAEATKAVGHEQNVSLGATESAEGYVDAFFSVAQAGGSPLAIGDYLDESAPQLPANAIITRILISVKEAKAGAGTLKAQLGGVDLATLTAVDTLQVADPGSFQSASAQDIGFEVSAGTLTAGAVRVRISYLRG